jgi:hypothetical protein
MNIEMLKYEIQIFKICVFTVTPFILKYRVFDNDLQKNSACANGGPRSRGCARKTLCSAPIDKKTRRRRRRKRRIYKIMAYGCQTPSAQRRSDQKV